MNQITDEWIKLHNPCKEAVEWWDKKERQPLKILKRLIGAKKYNWANWFVVQLLTHKQQVQYTVYAAEQVLDIFEKEYPNDLRPRLAIEAAKKWLKNPTERNRIAADAAANAAAYAAIVAANAAAYVAIAPANAAAYAAAYAANAVAHAAADVAIAAAHAAAYVAYAAAYVAHAAANLAIAAAYVAHAAATKNKMWLKILRYGMNLLRKVKP